MSDTGVLLVGTSGWSYPSWQPGFYPAGLDRAGFLSFYAERFRAVELNATKYRLPSQAQFESWAEQVPDGFRFAVKAPDRIERRLDVFEERVRGLGDRLGCVRIVVESPRDEGWLELVLGSADPAIRYAFDLRHESWDGIEQRLREAGAVRVGEAAGDARWAYLRFRALSYSDAELDEAALSLAVLAASTETFAFFRHGDAPDAPRAAQRVTRAALQRMEP